MECFFMKKLFFSSFFILSSLNVYANNLVSLKDSTNINDVLNCNNFIIKKEIGTQEMCPSGMGNSYQNEKGYATFPLRITGLDQKLDVYNFNSMNEVKNTLKQCVITPHRTYDHPSTKTIHQVLKPLKNEYEYHNCYNKCDNLNIDNNEYERKLQCPNTDGFFVQKYKKRLIIPSHIILKNDDKFIKPSDCALIKQEEYNTTNNQASACVPAVPADISTACQKINNKEYALVIGTVGDNYWGDGVHDRVLNFEYLLKSRCGISLHKDVKNLYVNRVKMDDWLEIKTPNNISYYSFPYNQYQHLEICYIERNYGKRFGMVAERICYDGKKDTHRGRELGTSWDFRNIRIKNILPYLNEDDSNVKFRTIVGGRGEFYALFKIETH